ncbi:DUF1932 domain-containing protein, partial [Amycolatopsis sp. NPDC003865]
GLALFDAATALTEPALVPAKLDLSGGPVAAVLPATPLGAPGGIASAAARAWRWEGEMAEIAEACAAAGLSPALLDAVRELFGRWREHRDDDGVTLPELLQALVTPPG